MLALASRTAFSVRGFRVKKQSGKIGQPRGWGIRGAGFVIAKPRFEVLEASFHFFWNFGKLSRPPTPPPLPPTQTL